MKKTVYLLSITMCVAGCRSPFFLKQTGSNTASRAVEHASENSFIPGLVPLPQGEAPPMSPVASTSTESPLSPIASSPATPSITDATPSILDATESAIPIATPSGYIPTPIPASPTPQPIQSASPTAPPQNNVTPTPSTPPTQIPSTPVPQTPSPDPAKVVTPIVFPQLSLFIDPKDQGKASVMESADTSDSLLENGHAIEIEPLTNTNQESVAVHAALSGAESTSGLTVFKKSPLVADWLKTDIPVVISGGYASIPVPAPGGGGEEYLIAGQEKPIPSGATFENIPIVTAPQDPLLTDDIQASSRSRAISQRKIQSVVHPAIPDSDVIKDPANKKILAILVHGAGSESKPGYRWGRLKAFALTKSARRQEVRDSFEFWSFQYDSTKEIAANALLLRDAIHAKFGARPYVVIAHSMGGLLSEFLYADEFSRKTFLGMVTLGTPHHGSPFAIPKMYRELASHQALPTLKYILYWGVSNNFVSTIPSPTGQNLIVDPFTDFTPSVFTIGHRCLAFDGFDGEIPTRTYTLPFIVGQEAAPLTETLSTGDRLCVPCQYSKLYTYPGLTNIPHTEGFPCYFNFAEGLRKLKEYTGSGTKPHAFRYAGYFSELVDARYQKVLLFDMAVKNLNGMLHNRTETAEQQALRYAAMDMLSLPSVTGGIQSPFTPTDGLVHVSSALAHKGRASIVDPRSTNARLILDEAAIEQQKPADTIANRLLPDYSHLDIVIGKSPDDIKLFGQIVDDMLWFKSEYDKRASYTLTVEDMVTLNKKTKDIVLLGENRDEQLSNGRRVYRATVTSSRAVASATEQNLATVTLEVQKSITVVLNNGSSYSEGTWTETHTATFGRINDAWYWITLR